MQPKNAIVRHDLSLSYNEFDARMNEKKYIGLKVFRPTEVGLQSASFNKFPAEAVMPPEEDLSRDAEGAYARDDFEWDSDTYATSEKGAEEKVDDRQIALYGDELRAEQKKRNRAVSRVARCYEVGAAGDLFNTTVWTGADLTTNISVPWSTRATADPFDDVDKAKDKVSDNCGYAANALVLSSRAFRNMIRTERVESLVKFSGHEDPKALAEATAALAIALQLDHIIIADDAKKNTADRGQKAVLEHIWATNMAMVCRIATDDDIESEEPCIGRTIVWTGDGAVLPGAEDETIGITVEEYREERVRGGIIRARTEFVRKIFDVRAGHLLTNIAA